ncbi:MAG: hypothetical protein ACFFCD_01520 [Promethearchaeota archaeon]
MSHLRKRAYDYIFKIAVVGPNDFLKDQVLHLISGGNIGVDGLRIHVGDADHIERIKLSYWLPHKDAFQVLVSLSYKGAHGALIVLDQDNIEVLTHYRAEVRKKCGKIPVLHLFIGKNTKPEEIHKMAEIKMHELAVKIRDRIPNEI